MGTPQNFILNGEIVGELAIGFPGPREGDGEFDDVADEYAVVLRPGALCGLIIYARYDSKWEANPWNERPVIRGLLEFIAKQDAEIEQLSRDRYDEQRRVDWVQYAKLADLESLQTYQDRRAFIDRMLTEGAQS